MGIDAAQESFAPGSWWLALAGVGRICTPARPGDEQRWRELGGSWRRRGERGERKEAMMSRRGEKKIRGIRLPPGTAPPSATIPLTGTRDAGHSSSAGHSSFIGDRGRRTQHLRRTHIPANHTFRRSQNVDLRVSVFLPADLRASSHVVGGFL
ncbi:hypothetical protein Droror1_Dr00020103 [Drosera rotundifolia]